jgi:hypothetical protein
MLSNMNISKRMLGKRNKKDSDYSPDEEYEAEEACIKKRKLPSTVHVY